MPRVMTNVISANQLFASTFSMQIFKFQRRSCKLSFLFLPRYQSAPGLLTGYGCSVFLIDLLPFHPIFSKKHHKFSPYYVFQWPCTPQMPPPCYHDQQSLFLFSVGSDLKGYDQPTVLQTNSLFFLKIDLTVRGSGLFISSLAHSRPKQKFGMFCSL